MGNETRGIYVGISHFCIHLPNYTKPASAYQPTAALPPSEDVCIISHLFLNPDLHGLPSPGTIEQTEEFFNGVFTESIKYGRLLLCCVKLISH